MIITLKNEKLTVKISTLGAELISAVGTDGHEYIYTGSHWGGHAPLLFPVCGSLVDDRYTYHGKEYAMAKHGLARRRDFTLLSATDECAVLSFAASEETRKYYPFDFELIAEYSITGEVLAASFTVRNHGEGDMPYMFGWHPAFVLGGEEDIGGFYLDFGIDGPLTMHTLNGAFLSGEKLSFPLDLGTYRLNEQQIYENDTLILTGTRGAVRLYGEGDIHEVTLTYGEGLPYVCVWKWPDSAARYICIEPWSGVPSRGREPENFDKREMSHLKGGESFTYEYTVEFSK